MIDYKTSDILDIYKNEYYNQKGSPLQIGSDDFAAASVHSYVLGVLISAFNHEAKNRFIETATGAALDGIAATFGLERPNGYRATIRVEFAYIQHAGTTATVIPAGDVVLDINGKKFSNIYDLTVSDGETVYTDQTLYAVEPGSTYNNIPSTADVDIERGDYWISSATLLSGSDGGTDGFPHTEAGDNAFREWLTTEIQSLAGAGTYIAYEARAKNADPRVLDVHVVRQSETEYQKGKVQIYVYTTDATGNVLSAVESACGGDAFRPIGDLVVVDASADYPISFSSSKKIQVTYPPQFSGSCAARNAAIFDAYNQEINSKIGAPFVFAELCRRLIQKDENGVYAIDAKPVGISSSDYTTPIYPPTGKRITVSSLSFDVVIGGV